MDAINSRRQQNGHGEFVDIIDHSDRQYPDQVPVSSNVKGDDQDDKAVDELGHQGRPGSPQPDLSLASRFSDLMEDDHINELAYQESHDRSDNDPKPLAKYPRI